MKKTFSALLLALIVCCASFGGIHVFAEEAPQAKPTLVEKAEARELSEWEGSYRSVSSYLAAEAVTEKLEKLAEAAGKTLEDYRANYDQMFQTDFAALEIEGNTVRFYDKAKDQGGKLVETSEYQHKATYSDKFQEFTFEWYEFATENPDSEHPVLLVMNLENEEGLTHFHMRYGKSADELFELPGWYATLVPDTTTDEQIGEMLEAHANEGASEEAGEEEEEEKLPEAEVLEDVDLKLWEGSWNNMGAFLKKDELQDAFKELAEKDEVSEEEARIAYKNRRRCEFDSLIIEGDMISFGDGMIDEKNADVYEKSSYEYKETYKIKWGDHDLVWHVFVSKDEDALYPNLLLMGVHGEEALTHFHMRYGKEDIQTLLEKDGWFPTFVGLDSTFEQLSAEITE